MTAREEGDPISNSEPLRESKLDSELPRLPCAPKERSPRTGE